MTIEFHSPAPPDEVHEWVIEDIKKKLTELHHLDKEVSWAAVYLTKNTAAFNGNYVCEIELTLFRNCVMVQRNAHSYLEAAKEVIKELTNIVNAQIRKHREMPELVTGTIDML